MKLPVVSSGVDKATYIYVKVKSSNRIIGYSLENAEKTVLTVYDMSVPIIIKLEDPINKIDDLMCKSLDIVVHNAPFVTYTPEEMYYTVKAKVEPVLKRADSVKQLSMLDDALSVADKYVDKYLPDKDPAEDVTDKPAKETSSQAVKTIRHVNHFSRKLQRRLTRRTIAEAKLLKKQGYDTVQCFVYFADLLAKDPKAFAEKMNAIWKHLSEDEPENQKPPENIEQLIEMLSRESARRFVHATNYIVKTISMLPTYTGQVMGYTLQETAALIDRIIKFAHLENSAGTIVDITNMQLEKLNKFIDGLRTLIQNYFSQLSTPLGVKESKNNGAEKDSSNNTTNAPNKPSQKTENNKPTTTADETTTNNSSSKPKTQ